MAGTAGWDAIDGALGRVYGRVEPKHFGTIVKHRLGGPDPLDGISIYPGAAPAHWHYVTYGMSELYEKESDDPAVSGFGFELTFRLANPVGEPEPPTWVLNFLNNLARYVFKTGHGFGVGHHLPLHGPIAHGHPTGIRAIVLALDPQLGRIRTPHGELAFLQVVGITEDEQDIVQEWSSAGLCGALAEGNPLLVTDLARASVFADPARAVALRERIEREGSSEGALFLSRLEWRKPADALDGVEVVIGAIAVESLLRLLKGRLQHGRDLSLFGGDAHVRLVPAEHPGWRIEKGVLQVELTRPLVAEMRATLDVRRGSYAWPSLPGLAIRVLPTEVKGQDGEVIETIG